MRWSWHCAVGEAQTSKKVPLRNVNAEQLQLNSPIGSLKK